MTGLYVVGAVAVMHVVCVGCEYESTGVRG